MLPETDGRVAATCLTWRHRGRTLVTVVAKAVFAIEPDRVASFRRPGTFDEARSSGDDRALHRARCDVTLVGRAHFAPGTVDPFVRLGLARQGRILLDKIVRVAADAPGGEDLHLGPIPEPAFGGPVGAFHGAAPDVADLFDWDVFQSAPRDQQVSFPAGDEWLVLDGFDPTAPRVATQLPSARAEARVRFVRGAAQGVDLDVSLHCDAMGVDMERRELTLVWRGAWVVPEHTAVGDCALAVRLADASQSSAWPPAPTPAQGPSASRPIDDGTMVQSGASAPFVLPFAASLFVELGGVAPPPEARAATVDDVTQPGRGPTSAPIAPFPLATALHPVESPAVLTGLPWGGPVRPAPPARPGDETMAAAPPPAAPGASAAELAARLREMAKDKDAIRKLMASLRSR